MKLISTTSVSTCAAEGEGEGEGFVVAVGDAFFQEKQSVC